MTRPVIGRTLWAARKSDDAATVRFCAKATPAGLTLLRNDPDGTWTGLTLTRAQVQDLRHALTSYLVDAAPDRHPPSRRDPA